MWDETTGETDASRVGTLMHEPQMAMGLARAPDEGLLGMLVNAAQSLNRDQGKMIARAKQIGGLLGSDGFYRFPVGNSQVQGASINMAQALAQEWGAILYKVKIEHIEQIGGGGQRVHLRASVADMKSLVCAEVDQVVSTTAPPGKFEKNVEQRERWHSMQIQSASSKIVRNAILRILPAWYVEPAFEAAVAADGTAALAGKSLPEARKGSAAALKNLGCSLEELEAYLGQPFDMWAVPQIGALRELYKVINSGAQSIESWRAGLSAKGDVKEAPRKSALGLAATSSAQPLDLGTTQAKAKEPVAKTAKAADKPAEQHDRQPGDDGPDKDPDFSKPGV
jgi:hypothetical protein